MLILDLLAPDTVFVVNAVPESNKEFWALLVAAVAASGALIGAILSPFVQVRMHNREHKRQMRSQHLIRWIDTMVERLSVVVTASLTYREAAVEGKDTRETLDELRLAMYNARLHMALADVPKEQVSRYITTFNNIINLDSSIDKTDDFNALWSDLQSVSREIITSVWDDIQNEK